MFRGNVHHSLLLWAAGPDPRLSGLGGYLQVLWNQGDGASRERYLHDRSGVGLQQQVDVFQVEFQNTVSGHHHHGVGLLPAMSAGGFQVWLCQPFRAVGLTEAGALGWVESFLL